MPARPTARGSAATSSDSGGSGGGGGGALRSAASAIASGPRQGMEWSLRSLHQIDTSAQHLISSLVGGGGGGGSGSAIDGSGDDGGLGAVAASGRYDLGTIAEDVSDQTAYEIFKQEANHNKAFANGKGNGGGGGGSGAASSSQADNVWESLHAPLREGVVDGKKVMFELRSDVTQLPETSRQERLNRQKVNIHSQRSSYEQRVRFKLMHWNVMELSVAFLAAFLFMAVFWASMFYVLPDGCCGGGEDGGELFSTNFQFAIQTATTIGYGTLSPVGMGSNCMVVILSYISILINTLFAGLLFTKFVTPVINIQFSDVMTMSNVNGLPCLSFRMGNADGIENPLTDINVRLTYSYQIPYRDHQGKERFFRQTEELKLLSNRQQGLREIWTLRHVLDESSPLFGLHFQEHPANKIYVFTLSVDAVQELTKSTVNVQTEYATEDILIGHTFLPVNIMDFEQKIQVSDYALINETEPFPVWYPAKHGSYANTGRMVPIIRKFGTV